jgi:hypothetical protein
MKLERNAPCPCGSGKKYKRCCMLKEDIAPVSVSVPAEPDYTYNDEELEHAQMMMNIWINLHKMTLEKKPHIKKYNKLRKIHGDVINVMMDYHLEGKYRWELSPINDPDYKVPPLEQLRIIDSDFDLTTDIGSQAFANVSMYKISSRIKSMSEIFLEEGKYKTPSEKEMLEAMANSEAGLCKIVEKDENNGYVYLRDVLSGKNHCITDIALSGIMGDSEGYIYTRIITFQGISFNSGLLPSFSKDSQFIIDWIERHSKIYNPQEELHRFLDLYNEYLERPGHIVTYVNEM